MLQGFLLARLLVEVCRKIVDEHRAPDAEMQRPSCALLPILRLLGTCRSGGGAAQVSDRRC